MSIFSRNFYGSVRSQGESVVHPRVSLRAHRVQAGFTLIELLVVLTIVTLISAVVLVDNNRFNSAILLRNLAYQIGLSVREAQLYGVSVRDVGNNNFNAAYGVDFNATDLTQSKSYPLFADLNNNGVFDEGGSAVVERFSIQSGFVVSALCVVDGSVLQCSGSCPSVLPVGITSCMQSNTSDITISFRRPDPNAIILTSDGAQHDGAFIYVASPSGNTHSVSIASTGLISIQ